MTASTKLTVLSEGWPLPRAMALDDTQVYFVNWGNGSGKEPAVVSVPKAGGTSTVLGTATQYPAAKSAFAAPDALALVGDTLYVRAASGSEIWKMPKAGGQPVAVVTHDTDPVMPSTPPTPPAYGFAVDGTSVYFPRTFWVDMGNTYTSGVYRAPLSGGAAVAIAEDLNGVNTPVGHAGTVLQDGSKLIWVHWDSVQPGSAGSIKTAGTDGSNVATLITTAMVQGIAQDAASLYYAQGPFLQSVPKSGGAPVVIGQVPGTSPYVYGVVLDADNIYVAMKDYGSQPNCGGVLRFDKTTHAMTTLSTGDRPMDVAVDGSAVFYTDLEAGTVMRVELP